MKTIPSLSIVIPCYNEVESLPILVDETVAVLRRLPCTSWEIILVDDGSTDGTTQLVTRFASEMRGVRAVLLRTNFGKSAALMAGFDESDGDIAITMDADLQDDPQEIPAFIDKIEGGCDFVSGWKKRRQDSFEKRTASLFFNWVVRKVSGLELHDSNCGFKAYRRWCIKELSLRGNQYRFVAAILSWRGATIGEIPVRHCKRRFGTSKYGIARYFQGASDLVTLILLTKFSQKPLYFFGSIGIPLMLLGVLLGGYLLVNHILFLTSAAMGFQLTNRPLLIVAAFLLLMGLLIFLFGLLAELVLRSTMLEQGYWVREVVDGKLGPKSTGEVAQR
jgi:glycosyltransferase involved in cell wall biosynthesis